MRNAIIWINGEIASWKRISAMYGENYCEELKECYDKADKWSTIYSEDGMIEINKGG